MGKVIRKIKEYFFKSEVELSQQWIEHTSYRRYKHWIW